ncbi:protein trigalactosyldiacylglycerol 2 chloroplastic [Phtheirospermum japonicum]|uniref:Protein trigalactosyldiacylglycerol 2 chloroplastic n=1 Tax=Phtheirospermum japonicum TaxID=374723 RepID=A0A830B8N3_9LAMI|nr:protein trigalactosyldiacylglycerol 2 chloroplastic [Phtheirospermum japonicum]
MEGNSLHFVSTCPQLPRPYLITRISGNGNLNFLPCLATTLRHKKTKPLFVKATSSSADKSSESSSESKSPLSLVLDVPRTIWKQTLRPLSDFGFGRKSVWEGGVGLFLVSGAFLLAFSLAWLRGFQLRSKFNKYLAVVEFDQASGICTGTPVRIRGVNVGNVVRVNPSLRSIEAVVEIDDDKVIIPRNSLIEVNQSGLLMETLIDITPRDPIPSPSVGPLHAGCIKEGLIVCDRQKIKGRQGVSLDALVGIFTRIGRDVEEIGVVNAYSLAERAAAIIEEARPLLKKIQAMAEDIEPLLAEVQDSGLLKDVECLTKSLTRASEEFRRVQSSIMTPENTELIQKSIYTLIFTLKNIENHKDVLVVVDSNDYPALLEYLRGGHDDPKFRRALVWKAFQHVASYDSAVSEWLWKQNGGDKFPHSLTISLSRKSELRYGENPHQKAAFYVDKSLAEVNAGGIATAIQHHGKEMSFNNYLDADAAWNCVCDFSKPTCVVVKHTNPCGVASRNDIIEAYRLAVKADPVSAFAWNDAVEEICKSGVSVIAEPGGSIRDADAIDCCNKYGVSLVLTNVRHFKH